MDIMEFPQRFPAWLINVMTTRLSGHQEWIGVVPRIGRGHRRDFDFANTHVRVLLRGTLRSFNAHAGGWAQTRETSHARGFQALIETSDSPIKRRLPRSEITWNLCEGKSRLGRRATRDDPVSCSISLYVYKYIRIIIQGVYNKLIARGRLKNHFRWSISIFSL